jgi:hypothetical protein
MFRFQINTVLFSTWQRIKVYYHRARRSSFYEAIYRGKQILQNHWLRYVISNGRLAFKTHSCDESNLQQLKIPSFDVRVAQDCVDSILKGSAFTLDSGREEIRKSEAGSAHKFFADIQGKKTLTDIRAVWEPARLQHIAMALVWCLKRNGDICLSVQSFARKALIEWIRENPFLYGLHYKSAMECGLRIPVFFYGLKLVDVFSDQDRHVLYNAIYQHAWWVSNRLSLYSSLGNHTICESVGLIFAGAVFRRTEKGERWLKTGIDLLEQEVTHQILEDGGPAEQSINYHRFVLDLYWLAVEFVEKNGLHDCSRMRPRLLEGEKFVSVLQDHEGKCPTIGDSDDGWAVAPGVTPKRAAVEFEPEKITIFRHSGYSIIRSSHEAILTFDHGPLGMAPLFNHGHADALSVTLSKAGRQILVDPGTYRYNGEPEYRRYFKGTRAHNTVNIDGLDQAVQETGFIWSRPYTCKVLKAQEESDDFFVQAVHHGYERLGSPVRHCRSILKFNQCAFVIKDTFSGKDAHAFELNFHFHPGSEIDPLDGWWRIRHCEAQVFLSLFGDEGFTLVKGQETPIHGWYSPQYGIKLPSAVLTVTLRGNPNNISFVTVIAMEGRLQIGPLLERFSEFEGKTSDTRHMG